MTIDIQITAKAASKMQAALQQRGSGEGIRLGVKTTGCSGLAYVLEYSDRAGVEDTVIEKQNIRVFIDAKSAVYLSGLEIDYIHEKFGEGFQFANPNEKSRCGCGESFTV